MKKWPTYLSTALETLHSEGVVAFPTETVYGLGADASSETAVQKIFQIKGRPSFNPLIVHVLNTQWIESIAVLPDSAFPLIQQYWPGPLTIVLPLKSTAPLASSVTANLPTVAIRIPQHPLFRELLTYYGKPIAAPSANISNTLSCTTAQHVKKTLGSRVSCILESDIPCHHGLESTIVDFSSAVPSLLRHGAISMEQVLHCLGSISFSHPSVIKSPGQLKRHYAPSIPLYLNAKAPLSGGAFLNFGPSQENETLNLSPTSSLEEAGANLFKMLHLLDNPEKFSSIAVAPIPLKGLGVSINDRLQRASTPPEESSHD